MALQATDNRPIAQARPHAQAPSSTPMIGGFPASGHGAARMSRKSRGRAKGSHRRATIVIADAAVNGDEVIGLRVAG